MLSMEPNNTIASANLIDLDNLPSVVISGDIGDINDVDFYRVDLNAGTTLIADIDNAQVSGLNSVLTVFNSVGTQVASNDDLTFSSEDGTEITELDSFLALPITEDGFYYVSVSSSDASLGSYDLELQQQQQIVATEPNDDISSATAIDFNISKSVAISGAIDDGLDVDFFQVQLNAGNTLIADIDNAEASGLNSVVTIFDASGNQVDINDDHTFFSEDGTTQLSESDSFLPFTATADGTYFVAVSGSGGTSGSYLLNLTTSGIQGSVVETESNDTILSANEINLDISAPVVVSGEIGNGLDVDFYQVQLNAGDTVIANIDAAVNGSALNSVVTVFDASGNQVGINDDHLYFSEDGTTQLSEPDSFLPYTAAADGTYYIAVSGSGSTSGSYLLNLSIDDPAPNTTGDQLTPGDGLTPGNGTTIDPGEII